MVLDTISDSTLDPGAARSEDAVRARALKRDMRRVRSKSRSISEALGPSLIDQIVYSHSLKEISFIFLNAYETHPDLLDSPDYLMALELQQELADLDEYQAEHPDRVGDDTVIAGSMNRIMELSVRLGVDEEARFYLQDKIKDLLRTIRRTTVLQDEEEGLGVFTKTAAAAAVVGGLALAAKRKKKVGVAEPVRTPSLSYGSTPAQTPSPSIVADEDDSSDVSDEVVKAEYMSPDALYGVELEHEAARPAPIRTPAATGGFRPFTERSIEGGPAGAAGFEDIEEETGEAPSALIQSVPMSRASGRSRRRRFRIPPSSPSARQVSYVTPPQYLTPVADSLDSEYTPTSSPEALYGSEPDVQTAPLQTSSSSGGGLTPDARNRSFKGFSTPGMVRADVQQPEDIGMDSEEPLDELSVGETRGSERAPTRASRAYQKAGALRSRPVPASIMAREQVQPVSRRGGGLVLPEDDSGFGQPLEDAIPGYVGPETLAEQPLGIDADEQPAVSGGYIGEPAMAGAGLGDAGAFPIGRSPTDIAARRAIPKDRAWGRQLRNSRAKELRVLRASKAVAKAAKARDLVKVGKSIRNLISVASGFSSLTVIGVVITLVVWNAQLVWTVFGLPGKDFIGCSWWFVPFILLADLIAVPILLVLIAVIYTVLNPFEVIYNLINIPAIKFYCNLFLAGVCG